jgi:hypothetical protein
VRLEAIVGNWFKLNVEDLIKQSTSLANQYFPEYFTEPTHFGRLVMNLCQLAIPYYRSFVDGFPYAVVLDDEHEFRIRIVEFELEFIDPTAEIPVFSIPNGFNHSYKGGRYQISMSDKPMREIILTGAISHAIALRWLEGMPVTERMDLLSLENWRFANRT